MKRSNAKNSIRHFRPFTILALTLCLLFFLGSFSPTLLYRFPTISLEKSSKSTDTSPIINSVSMDRLFQNITEGQADVGALVVGDDGSLTATFLSAGSDVGEFDTSQGEYEYCLMALAMFRWGDYEGLTENLLAFLGNESDSGMTDFLEFLDMLPLSSILMVFYGGEASDLVTWGSLIAEDFTVTLGMPFTRITGIPPLTIENMTFGVEAYGYEGTDLEARDGFQEYMADLGSERNGMSEMVTPEVAGNCNGSIGVCGLINMGAMSEGPTSRAPLQDNETLIFSSWTSLHMDQFYGREDQFFDLNVFCDRTGDISMADLDSLDFTILLPAEVNVTDYYPDDMTNTTSPESVTVSRSTSQWQAVPSVETINITFHGPFPPGIHFTKEINPSRVSPGGLATVKLTVKNIDPNQTIFNITVADTHSWDLYAGLGTEHIIIIGETTAYWDQLLPGESGILEYQVGFATEGIYFCDRANVTFSDIYTDTFVRQSNQANVAVFYANIFEFLLTLFNDIPWSIPVILIVGLMILYLVIALIRSFGRKSKPKLQPAPPISSSPPETPEPPKPPKTPTPGAPTSEICVNCGALVPPGVTYCPACGAQVVEEF